MTGRSAVWLARLPWEQEAPSSNLGAPIPNGKGCAPVAQQDRASAF